MTGQLGTRKLARLREELSKIGWATPNAADFDDDAWGSIVVDNLLLGGLEEVCCREDRDPETVERVCDEAHEALERLSASHVLGPEAEAAARTIVTCARIAALDRRHRRRLPNLLEDLPVCGEAAPTEKHRHDSSLDNAAWEALVHRVFHGLTWSAQLSAPWAWDTVHTLWGRSRPVVSEVKTLVLLVVGHDEVAAQLTLQLLGDEGSGVLYPHPRVLGLVWRDKAWLVSERAAVAWVNGLGMMPKDRDVRWCLERVDGGPIRGLEGASAGGAFGLSLAKLFALQGEGPPGQGWLEQLKSVDPGRVAVSATIDANGALSPVTGLWEKTGAAAKAAGERRLLAVVVVSESQTGVPESYLDSLTDRSWFMIRATCVPAAVEALYEEHGPRARVREWVVENCGHIEFPGGYSLPMSQGYRVLPLMREVPADLLPAEGMARSSDEEPVQDRDDLSTTAPLGQDPIPDYERLSLGMRTTVEPVRLVDLLQDSSRFGDGDGPVPRMVVLGVAGGGKSTLMRYLAYRAAIGDLALPGGPFLAVAIKLGRWQRWAAGANKEDLADYLHVEHGKLQGHPTARQWRRWLRWGDVLLLLDGLDEVEEDEDFDKAVAQSLSLYKRCPVVLTCRTMYRHRHRTVCPQLPVFQLGSLDRLARESFICSFPADAGSVFSAEGVIAELKDHPDIEAVASTPLILAILCAVLDEPGGATLPATRTELYDRTVTKLLMRTRGPKVHFDGLDPPDLAQERGVLEDVAMAMFLWDGQSSTTRIDQRSLLAVMTKSLHRHKFPGSVAASLLRRLARCGILRGRSGGDHFFLHRSFQEYLAASGLARQVNGGSWKSAVEFDGRSCPVREVVDQKAWDPAWHETIRLLAGCLKDPVPLLEILADEAADRPWRPRLGLAGRCLPEIPRRRRRGRVASTVDDITTALVKCWWAHRTRGTDTAVSDVTASLKDTARAGGRVEGQPFSGWVMKRLGNRATLGAALDLVEHTAPHISASPVVEAVLHHLEDEDEGVRARAADALGAMGDVAASHDVVAALVQRLKDESHWVRRRAKWALGGMGGAAAVLEALAALRQRLEDEDLSVRAGAADTLGGFGEAAASPDVLDALLRHLEHEETSVRFAVMHALGAIGKAAASPDVLGAMLRQLEDEDVSMRSSAAEALGNMGDAAAALPEVSAALTRLLDDDDPWVRRTAAEALGKMGDAAALPKVSAALSWLLDDDDPWVRGSAAGALGVAEHSAARPEDLAVTQQRLGDEDPSVRASAARDLGALDGAAAKPEVLHSLIRCLGDEDPSVGASAACTLGAMGKAAGTPEVLDALLMHLKDRHSLVGDSAGVALGAMGKAAATPEVLDALVSRLDTERPAASWNAALALGAMGKAAATATVLDALVEQLHHDHHRVRRGAADALALLVRYDPWSHERSRL